MAPELLELAVTLLSKSSPHLVEVEILCEPPGSVEWDHVKNAVPVLCHFRSLEQLIFRCEKQDDRENEEFLKLATDLITACSDNWPVLRRTMLGSDWWHDRATPGGPWVVRRGGSSLSFIDFDYKLRY